MLAAVAQICSGPSITRNLTLCRNIIRNAANRGAQLVYLPEASDFIAPTSSVLSLSSTLEASSFVTGVRDEAKQSQVWVGLGVHETSANEPQRVFNTHIMIDPSGNIKSRYEKLHLFDVDIKGGTTILESRTTIPGSGLVSPVDTAVGRVGLLTCYDIRFPEVSLILRKKGAQLISYPSAFTMRTGEAHWETLLRARAIETQSYILAPAQVGEHFPPHIQSSQSLEGSTSHVGQPADPRIIPGRYSYGSAMVIDPWGTVIARCTDDISKGDSFCLAEIDLDWLERVRKEMPLWQQRRDDVYQLQHLEDI